MTGEKIMKKQKAFFVCCMFVGLNTGIFAEDVAMPRVTVPTAQSSGMGGPHVAYTDNVFSLLINPAAMMRTEQRSFFAISPTLYSPQSTFGLIDTIESMVSGGGTSALGKAANIFSKQKGKINLGFALQEFPFSIAWVADGFGFGLWNRLFVNPAIIGTHLSFDVYGDVMLPVGFAFKILDTEAHSLDAGVTLKPFVRIRASEKLNLMDLMNNEADILSDFSVPLIMGAGFDLGFLYRWNTGFRAGITLDDIISRGTVAGMLAGTNSGNNSYYVPFSMNLGLAYDFKFGQIWEAAPDFLARSGLTVAFDWRDFTNLFQQDDYTKRNAALDMGMGLQLSFIDMIKLRMGINEMLPAFGLGFDFGPIEIDAAYYGKEFGLEPGQLSTAALDLTLAIRPGAQKRTWPWTRNSLVGLFNE
jgi:hypothetical protein